MSGSGGSSPPRGGNGGDVDCDSLVVETALNSPEPTVVNTLRKGSKLSVELGKTAQGREIILAVTEGKKTAGSLTPPRVLEIMNCLRRGHTYVAEVLANPDGGDCRVRIRSANS